MKHSSIQRILTYFIRGSITVRMTSSLTGFDLTEQVKLLLFIQQKQSSKSQTSKTGGQQYTDTSPYEVSEYSLLYHTIYLGKVYHVSLCRRSWQPYLPKRLLFVLIGIVNRYSYTYRFRYS